MSEWVRAWHRYRRQNRFLIASFLLLLGLSVLAAYLLQRANAVSPQDLTNRLLLFVLWYLDVSLILVLAFILSRNLFRLAVERKSGVLGSRFRTKLVLTYIGLSLVPVIFIFLVANNLLQRSIDRWFSAPVEEVLSGSAEIAEEIRELIMGRLEQQALRASAHLEHSSGPDELTHLHGMMGVDLIAIYEEGNLVHAITNARRIPSSLPPLDRQILRKEGRRADRWRGGLLIRAWQPIGEAGNVVVVGDMLPHEVLLHLERATAAHANFQEMKLQQGTISSTTALVFLAITLLLLFATVWLGLFLSRRFTDPLLAVASATQRVVDGRELEEVSVPASDEVGVLVDSFNAMVRRVRATEMEILASNQELGTILATVPTGVLTLNSEGTMFRPNFAASRLFSQKSWAGEWQSISELHCEGLEPLAQALDSIDPGGDGRQVVLESGGTARVVDVTLQQLPGGGRVVAVDDLTQLVRAQRQAAWSEVARRIAHEIKNPLTPIRLAAERIERKARGLDNPLQQTLISSCEAIVAHVSGLKELVDAFHSYARMPAVNPKPSQIGRLFHEVVSLYENLRSNLKVTLNLVDDELRAHVDPVLIRQALVNLLDNAVEATPAAGEIQVDVDLEESDLTVTISDRGSGLPTDDPELLFQPFFSTKGRGSGMGLALVHRIVADHGGTLELSQRAGGGTLVRMVLPGAVIQEPV
ncbi:MAG: HAMP domain-containing protein [bacterium]|nr:HAMP domain-containing protein [bacterium]